MIYYGIYQNTYNRFIQNGNKVKTLNWSTNYHIASENADKILVLKAATFSLSSHIVSVSWHVLCFVFILMPLLSSFSRWINIIQFTETQVERNQAKLHITRQKVLFSQRYIFWSVPFSYKFSPILIFAHSWLREINFRIFFFTHPEPMRF